MKKSILITFIVFFNLVLCGNITPSHNATASNKNASGSYIDNLPPINITPLYAPDLSNITRPEKRKHSPHVQEKKSLQNKMATEGKIILTITYTGSGTEGYDFLKEQYPDFFESVEALTQKASQAPHSTIQPSLKKTAQPLAKIPQWLLESSLDNAPVLLKGILTYLQTYEYNKNSSNEINIVSSFHRFILEGPPGTGKTTLAYAIANLLGYPIVFIPATSLLGRFRNETSNNIEKLLLEQTTDELPKVIIIDELHKLFEHHANDRTDDSQSAAAFWLAIDRIEKYNPNIIIIGTANSVAKLPPEIKSRFSGKIIRMPLLNKNQKMRTFKRSIAHDKSVVIDKSVNNTFIVKMLQQIEHCSLRDVQLIIDSAKMFYYEEQPIYPVQFPMVLTRVHFQRALHQLQAESHALEENFTEKMYKKIKKYGIVLSAAVNVSVLIRASSNVWNTQIIKNLLPQ